MILPTIAHSLDRFYPRLSGARRGKLIVGRILALAVSISSGCLSAQQLSKDLAQQPASTATARNGLMAIDAPGVTVNLRGAPLLHRSAVDYPAAIRTRGVGGTVVMEIAPDWQGHTDGIRVLSGPQELRKHVITSVMDWHFSRTPETAAYTIAITFNSSVSSPAPPRVSLGIPNTNTCFWTALRGDHHVVKAVNIVGLSDDAGRELLQRLPPKDDPRAHDAHVMLNAVRDFDGDLSLWVLPSGNALTITVVPPGFFIETSDEKRRRERSYHCDGECACELPRASEVAAGSTPSRIEALAATQAEKLLSRVEPQYPAAAKANHIQAIVRLQAIIGRDGRVLSVTAIKGHVLLVEEAKHAVLQWIYAPTLVNGQPVEVRTEIDVEFFTEE